MVTIVLWDEPLPEGALHVTFTVFVGPFVTGGTLVSVQSTEGEVSKDVMCIAKILEEPMTLPFTLLTRPGV